MITIQHTTFTYTDNHTTYFTYSHWQQYNMQHIQTLTTIQLTNIQTLTPIQYKNIQTLTTIEHNNIQTLTTIQPTNIQPLTTIQHHIHWQPYNITDTDKHTTSHHRNTSLYCDLSVTAINNRLLCTLDKTTSARSLHPDAEGYWFWLVLSHTDLPHTGSIQIWGHCDFPLNQSLLQQAWSMSVSRSVHAEYNYLMFQNVYLSKSCPLDQFLSSLPSLHFWWFDVCFLEIIFQTIQPPVSTTEHDKRWPIADPQRT